MYIDNTIIVKYNIKHYFRQTIEKEKNIYIYDRNFKEN